MTPSLGTDRNLANAAFLLALLALLTAFGFQYLGGFEPCELCYQQRVPYYFGLPLLAVTLWAWQKLGKWARLALTAIVAALFVWGTYLGGYHAGVEWGFWPGPDTCSGLGGGINFGDLDNLDASRVVPCDRPQIRILGLSFAGMNAIVSFVVVVLLGASLYRQARD